LEAFKLCGFRCSQLRFGEHSTSSTDNKLNCFPNWEPPNS
jgi:hypothetical protein